MSGNFLHHRMNFNFFFDFNKRFYTVQMLNKQTNGIWTSIEAIACCSYKASALPFVCVRRPAMWIPRINKAAQVSTTGRYVLQWLKPSAHVTNRCPVKALTDKPLPVTVIIKCSKPNNEQDLRVLWNWSWIIFAFLIFTSSSPLIFILLIPLFINQLLVFDFNGFSSVTATGTNSCDRCSNNIHNWC